VSGRAERQSAVGAEPKSGRRVWSRTGAQALRAAGRARAGAGVGHRRAAGVLSWGARARAGGRRAAPFGRSAGRAQCTAAPRALAGAGRGRRPPYCAVAAGRARVGGT